MQLVILAAGQGSRLGEDAGGLPKSLVRCGENIYLGLQLKRFAGFAFSKKIVVGGYAYPAMCDYLASSGHEDFITVENREFKKGNLLSLLAAKQHLSEGFFIFNADHYYSENTYKKIFSVKDIMTGVFCDRDRPLGDDDMKVASSPETAFNKVKFISKTLSEHDCGYVGVTYIPASQHQIYWQEAQKALVEEGEGISVERIIGRLAAKGETIKIHDVSGSWWTEIDTPEDLRKARETIARLDTVK